MPYLQTPRLILIPFELRLVNAALHDRAELGRLLAARVPDNWPNDDVLSVLPQESRLLATEPQRAEWSYLIVHAGERTVIGDIGFHAPPNANGTVELGYDILAAYRRHGYAVEAGQALLDWAFRQPEVRSVAAECLAANIASIGVLEKLGLRRVSATESSIWWSLTREEWLRSVTRNT